MIRKSVWLTVISSVAVACGSRVDFQSSENQLRADWMEDRRIPRVQDGMPAGVVPILPQQAAEYNLTLPGGREPDRTEESGGLDTADIDLPYDSFEPKAKARESRGRVVADFNPGTWTWYFQDPDGDCLVNLAEMSLGTQPDNPDSDGDGWFDGACNQRRKLVLEWIKTHDEQEDAGQDEFYLVVDDVRHPHGNLDDFWDFDDGDSRGFNRVLAERVRGTNRNGRLRNVRVEGWEDDVEAWNTWTADDLLFEIDVDLDNYSDGETFTIRKSYDDWDYEIRFRVEVEYFADPQPVQDGDSDSDGIAESAEFEVCQTFGGISDPAVKDILVEVDWMPGRGLTTQAKRLVSTRYKQHGYDLFIYRHQLVPTDSCLTLSESRDIYNQFFTYGHLDAFRYALMGGVLYNDAAEMFAGDAFFIDESTGWIDGDVLAQAGTLIHALGHSVGLNQSVFHLIDTIAWFSYDSAMNYTFQATRVDYSNDGDGGESWDHDDWEDVDAGYALKYSFGLGYGQNDGICN